VGAQAGVNSREELPLFGERGAAGRATIQV
jgi:hypothetical protein